MAVAHSADSNGSTSSTNSIINDASITNASTTLNTITIGASDTTCIILIEYNAAATTTGWTIKVGTATASLITGSSFSITGANIVSVIAFEVKNPPSGAQNITGFNTGFVSTLSYLSAMSFTGSDTVNPSVAFGGTGTAATTATTGSSGSSIPSTDMVAAWFADDTAGFGSTVGSYGTTGGASLTFVDNNQTLGSGNVGETRCTGNNAAVTMTATQTSDIFAALGIWVKVPAGTTLGGAMQLMFM